MTAENKPDCAKPHGKYQAMNNSKNPAFSARIATYKDQRGIQIFIPFPLEVPVVFFHFSLEFVVELHPGVNPRSSATQHGLQGIAKGLFQSFAVRLEIM